MNAMYENQFGEVTDYRKNLMVFINESRKNNDVSKLRFFLNEYRRIYCRGKLPGHQSHWHYVKDEAGSFPAMWLFLPNFYKDC